MFVSTKQNAFNSWATGDKCQRQRPQSHWITKANVCLEPKTNQTRKKTIKHEPKSKKTSRNLESNKCNIIYDNLPKTQEKQA